MSTKEAALTSKKSGRRALALVAVLAVTLVGAVTTPTYAAPRVGSVTVDAQTGTLTTGTAGSVTYQVTVVKGNQYTLTANLSIAGLPPGVTASFVPASLVWGSFLPAGTTRTSTLTITTLAATPPAVTPFTVTATRSTDPADSAAGGGMLTVLANATNPQTITFAPLVDKTFGDPDFTVSATASSGLPVIFAPSGDCTVTIATVHLTGPGTCEITASQGGNDAFAPAPSVARAFTIFAAATGTDLYAVSGTAALPGQSVTVWGYNTANAAVVRPGGPTLTFAQGDTVTIRLHNQLGENTGLLVQGQKMVPDRTGVAPGGTKQYTFIADRPGTYLYEAALLPNAQHQVAMGLYGALVVVPAAAGAYGTPATEFDDQAVLVLAEIDPALNNRATPASFDMRNFKPKYFLINGEVYPNTAQVPTEPGHRVLLRYVNAGSQYHSMALLGAHQTVVALDGSELAFPRRYVAETFGPGQTTDAIVTIPTDATDGTKFAVYDANLTLRNSNTPGFGGMLTFLAVAGIPGTADTIGPLTNNVVYVAGTLTATVDDSATGVSIVAGAEYFLDTVATPGTGTAMNAADGTFGSVSEGVTFSPITIPSGLHTLYVRGRDAANNWGALTSLLVDGGDATGPTTKSPSLTPSLTNGLTPVAVHATGDDTVTGGSNIVAAEYFVGADPGAGSATAMTVNVAGPIASLDGTISATTLGALAPNTYVVSIRSKDAAGYWGAPTTIDLVVVGTTGPTSTNVSVAPNPNNGTVAINASTPAVRVVATFTSAQANVTGGEAFLCSSPIAVDCPIGANGTGIPMAAVDGTFNSTSEAGYAFIPLATVIQLTNGAHTIHVHGKDAAGNWGVTTSTVLVIDKAAPTVLSIVRDGADPTNAANVNFIVTFSEPVIGVTTSNFALASGAAFVAGATVTSVTGSGASRTVTTTTGTGGGGMIRLDLISATGITDLATNALTGVPVVGQFYTQPSPTLQLSTLGNTNPPGVAGTADDADIYSWNGTNAFSRLIDASVAPVSLPAGANVDGYVRVSATQFYLSFSGTTTAVPGIGNVEDEDVVYYNNGVWSVYFDGTSHGLGTSGNLDLDAIDVVGGVLYFSTVGNSNPPGVPGTADDADIYSWNGTSYARVWDATVNGLLGGANVDGFVRVDATHFYLSFSSTTTTVPGIGSVEDEDVVYSDGGTWSVYFNGTALGLTSDNLDIDAFDLP